METSVEPPCDPLKDTTDTRKSQDHNSIVEFTDPLPPLPPSPGRSSTNFPAIRQLVNRRVSLTSGGMAEVEELIFSPRSSASRITSVQHITPFKEEISARGSGLHVMTSRTGLSTARSSSISVNSRGSNGWGKSFAYISPSSGDEYSVSRVPRSLCFQRGKIVGSGGFGTVYQAILSDGSLAAIKEMKRDTDAKAIDREVRTLSSLPPHPHCVRYFGSRLSRHHHYIIMEYISGGSIQSLRSSVGRFKESVMQRYARMVLLGLQHLHQNGIIHRDIKGANVLLDEKGYAKIVDFGCCKNLNIPQITLGGGGTPLWMAPEVCRGETATAKSDVWGVGCLCLEMTNDTGVPWSFPAGTNAQGVAYAIASAKNSPPIPSHLSSFAQDFIRSCLQIDAEDRLTVDELLQHKFFSQDLAEQDDENEDVILSREGSLEQYSSHSKIRYARGNVTEKSDNDTNVKIIVSATTSANSSRINNNRKRETARNGEFRLEPATDDDDDYEDTSEGNNDDHYSNGGNYEFKIDTNNFGKRGSLNGMNDTADTIILAIPSPHSIGSPGIVVPHQESLDFDRSNSMNSGLSNTLVIRRGSLNKSDSFERAASTQAVPQSLALPLPQQGIESNEERFSNSLSSIQSSTVHPLAAPIEWESYGSDSVIGGKKSCKKNERRIVQSSTGRHMRHEKHGGFSLLGWFK
ncbi:putative protein kinase [Trypanosoma theileri]|uniref:Protein kinase domain-containing protein n=1 Tax=Trypanosoma theileri TaxID=67003 RepID=A0A1X0P484_9TRYP|nr:putative protein kinase [Trypanosoma theileri]ORC91732.1 putative protein kinase [Trypanosoma theileri]